MDKETKQLIPGHHYEMRRMLNWIHFKDRETGEGTWIWSPLHEKREETTEEMPPSPEDRGA